MPAIPLHIEGSRVFITGANRGIGLGFVEALLKRGAEKIYAAARTVSTLEPVVSMAPQRIVPIELDVNQADQRQAAAEKAEDVTVLINNSGISGSPTPENRHFLAAETLEDARLVMETNFFSPAELARLFAPQIVASGHGAIVNIISIGALFCVPEFASYSASKAAALMMTNGLRAELDKRDVLVSGVYTAGVETRMSSGNPGEKVSPLSHANEVLDALAKGEEHIYSGAGAEDLRVMIQADPKAFERRCIDRFHTNPLN